jgi:phosphatidylserine decarboxylase
VNATTGSASARWRILIAILARLPQGGLSRMTGRVARLTIPRPLRAPLLGAFARSLGAAVHEAERPLHEYRSFDEFFVRRLRPGARVWPRDPNVVASPVDGVIGEFGRIESGRALQAKGRHYSLARLLDSPDWARYESGDFITLYLSPRHYHRVHAPVFGRIPRTHWIPGALMPVNAAAIDRVDDLFPRNERVVCWLENATGSLAIIAVGAFNVGRITAAFDPELSTNAPRAGALTRTYDSPILVDQGDEILAFHLGSTVILLSEPGRIAWKDSVEKGREVRLGQAIASVR